MLLFLALMIVYVLWYQIKGTELQKQIQQQTSWSVYITAKTGDTIQPISSTGKVTAKTWETLVISKTTTWTMSKASTIRLLSGTDIYYWQIEVIEKLGIKYQYALTDTSWIWYIYLGTPSYDFASIAGSLKGSLFTLATEQDIINNKLFGNKVVFINLPEYKDKQVVMLIYLNDGIWLIQVDAKIYHKSKAYIKSLFIH